MGLSSEVLRSPLSLSPQEVPHAKDLVIEVSWFPLNRKKRVQAGKYYYLNYQYNLLEYKYDIFT